MSSPAPICTHIKTDGVRCGSPAVSGTDFCYHHSAVKTALGSVPPQAGSGDFAPIPFVFPEDRSSMQINYFLLLQAFNESRIDLRIFKAMMSLLKSMAANLGKTGSLVDEEARAQGAGLRAQENSSRSSAISDQKNRVQGTGRRAQEGEERVAPVNEAFEFSPELIAKLEEIEKLDMNDPGYAERIRAAVVEGTKELKARGLDLMEISPVACSPIR